MASIPRRTFHIGNFLKVTETEVIDKVEVSIEGNNGELITVLLSSYEWDQLTSELRYSVRIKKSEDKPVEEESAF